MAWTDDRGASDQGLAADAYERYFDRLYGYLCSVLDVRADAEDVTHQVFEDLLKALDSAELHKVRSLRRWLFAVGHNRAANHRRKHERVDVTTPDEMTRRFGSLRQASQEQEHNLSWIFGVEVAAAIRRLPALPREVVLLRYVGDFDLAEIADVMDVSEDSVKQAHRRALTALREHLGSSAGDGPTDDASSRCPS